MNDFIRLLFYMSFMGSVPLLFYYVIRWKEKELISAAASYSLLLLSALFFLVPFPLLSLRLRSAALTVYPTETPFWKYNKTASRLGSDALEVQFPRDHTLLLNLCFVLWIIIFTFMLLRALYSFFHLKEWIKRHAYYSQTLTIPFFSLKRKVKLYICEEGYMPFSSGWLFPMIILPEGIESEETNSYILLHELSHVKHMDILICFIAAFIRSLHWFNPFAYLLFKELKLQQEFMADTAVMKQLSLDEQKTYGNLIIHMLSTSYSPILPNRFASEFINTSYSDIKERIERMKLFMKKMPKKRSLIICAILIVIAANAFPAMAYEKKPIILNPETISDSEGDIFFFYNNESAPDETELFRHSDMYFVDENTKYIPISSQQIIQNENARACSHSWETGTIKRHIKNSDGSCDVNVFHAKRCTKCGSILLQELLYTMHYPKCLH